MSWIRRSVDGEEYFAQRADGVRASLIHPTSKFPYAVSRGRGETYETLPGKARSSRAFRTLDAAIKAADKAWPMKGAA